MCSCPMNEEPTSVMCRALLAQLILVGLLFEDQLCVLAMAMTFTRKRQHEYCANGSTNN